MDSLAPFTVAGAAFGYEVHRRLDAGSFFGEQACLTGELPKGGEVSAKQGRHACFS